MTGDNIAVFQSFQVTEERDWSKTCELFRYPDYQGFSELITLDGWQQDVLTHMKVSSYKCGSGLYFGFCAEHVGECYVGAETISGAGLIENPDMGDFQEKAHRLHLRQWDIDV